MVANATAHQVKALQKISKEIPEAQDLFELLASRVRGRFDFGRRRTIRVLREHGTKISKDQFDEICHRLQMAGVGETVQGVAGEDKHFKVFYHLISIAKAAKGEVMELDPVPGPKVVLPHLALVKEQATVSHLPPPVSTDRMAAPKALSAKFITVRYGSFEMDVPLSMDAEEREQAAELIASLPQVKS